MEPNERQLSISELLEVGKMNISLMNNWEKTFLMDTERRFYRDVTITPKQEKCLRDVIDGIYKELERVSTFSINQILYIKKLKGLV